MTMLNDAKFEEKLTLGSKNDMRNLVNFRPTTQSPKISLRWTIFLSKVYEVRAKKSTEELSFMTLKSDAKFE